MDLMTDQTPLAAGFHASVRVQLFYAPDPRFKVDAELEAALIAERVAFALPPAKGDRFIPGQLSQALLGAQLTPVVEYVEHAPVLPFHDDYADGGYAVVVINCTSPRVPSDELLAELREEGWTVRDFRDLAGHRREEADDGMV